MNTNFNDVAEHYNKTIEYGKKMAIKRYNKKDSKRDFISEVVGSFIISNLRQIRPLPPMLTRYWDDDSISVNMLLDSIGDCGILIGASAYRLAEQLELELPDNGIKPHQKSTAAIINGQLISGLELDSKISGCYLRYFEEHSLSMFLQNGYWLEQIRNAYTVSNPSKKGIADCYFQLQCVSKNSLILRFVYDMLKYLYLNDYTEEHFKYFKNMKDGYAACVNGDIDNFSEELQRDILLTYSCLSACVDEIEKIFKPCQ